MSIARRSRVLVVEDSLHERQPVFERLFEDCDVTWASNHLEVEKALEQGPFDIYCLDYDLGEARGGWLDAGHRIRESDPRSIAKIVLIHSANTNAREYFQIFPAAIFIQWDVLATILGVPLVDNDLIDVVLAKAGSSATEDELKQIVLEVRSGDQTG